MAFPMLGVYGNSELLVFPLLPPESWYSRSALFSIFTFSESAAFQTHLVIPCSLLCFALIFKFLTHFFWQSRFFEMTPCKTVSRKPWLVWFYGLLLVQTAACWTLSFCLLSWEVHTALVVLFTGLMKGLVQGCFSRNICFCSTTPDCFKFKYPSESLPTPPVIQILLEQSARDLPCVKAVQGDISFFLPIWSWCQHTQAFSLVVFGDKVSLISPDQHQTRSLPGRASQVLRLQSCPTTEG